MNTPTFLTPNNLINNSLDILVIGAGGTGGYVLAELAQLSDCYQKLGSQRFNVTVIDGDTVSEFNVGRQNFHQGDIGYNKAEVLVARCNQFYGMNWKACPHFLEPSEFETLDRYDVVLTCVDRGVFRYELGKAFDEIRCKTLWIDGGNDKHNGQVIMGYLSNFDKSEPLPNVFDLFGEALNNEEEDEKPSCSHEEALSKQEFGVNRMIAHSMVQLLWQLLRKGQVSYHGQFLDLSTGDTVALRPSQETWASFGFGQ